MLGATVPLKGYDKKFFSNRSQFFEMGYYKHILDEVREAVKDIMASSGQEQMVLIDAGCGEGYYSEELAKIEGVQIVALDIAADAIKQAAKSNADVAWTIADITNIPVKDHVCDVILDVFTPANYGEFSRILKEGGYIIKIIPGANHLIQLRKAASDQLRNKEYSGEDVSDYFEKHYRVVRKETLSNTMPISQETLKVLAAMTPLLFDADKSLLNLSDITEITIEAQLLIGKAK